MTKPPETDVTTRCKRGLTNESCSSTTHKHGKTDERNSFVMEGTTAGRKRTQWSQGKQTGARRLREIGERETECESDGWNWCTQTRENFRSSTFQGSPVTLYLTISLSWCQRPTDLVICKLYFEGGRRRRRRGINQKERRNVRSRCHFSILPQEKCPVHSLLGSPCGRISHSASAWGWLWPWSGWWGSYWPDRCCSTFSRPAEPYLRGSLCAARSRLWARPVRDRSKTETNTNVTTEDVKTQL